VCLFQELNGLDDDGVVGMITRQVLLDARKITFSAKVERPDDGPDFSKRVASFSRPRTAPAKFSPSPFLAMEGDMPVGQSAPVAPPAHRQVQVFIGQEVNVNPWFVQPMVVAGQVDWVLKNNGRPDLTLTPRGCGRVQLAYATMAERHVDGSGVCPNGPQRSSQARRLRSAEPVRDRDNSNEPGPGSTIGLGIGNQMMYN